MMNIWKFIMIEFEIKDEFNDLKKVFKLKNDIDIIVFFMFIYKEFRDIFKFFVEFLIKF